MSIWSEYVKTHPRYGIYLFWYGSSSQILRYLIKGELFGTLISPTGEPSVRRYHEDLFPMAFRPLVITDIGPILINPHMDAYRDRILDFLVKKENVNVQSTGEFVFSGEE